MVAPVVKSVDAIAGVHITYIKLDGTGKYPFLDNGLQRECRGPISGGAVRLAPHDPERELIVGEGIECVLSAMQLFNLPGWAALSTSGVTALELPVEVRRIVIAVDNDINRAGQEAALTAYYRWKQEGRLLRTLIPSTPGADFNDLLRGVAS